MSRFQFNVRDGVAFLLPSTGDCRPADSDVPPGGKTTSSPRTKAPFYTGGAASLDEALGGAEDLHREPEENEGSAVQETPGAPAAGLNAGSVGHPLLCRHQCNFFQEGQCRRDSGCGYCHLSHDGMLMKLDSINKNQLRDMDTTLREEFLRAVLHAKMEQILAFPKGAQLAEEWRRRVGESPPLNHFKSQSPALRRLGRHLCRMSVGILCGIASTTCGEGCALVEATEELLASLRAQL